MQGIRWAGLLTRHLSSGFMASSEPQMHATGQPGALTEFSEDEEIMREAGELK